MDGAGRVAERGTDADRVTSCDPDARISAATIDATDPGLEREPTEPSGLGGWSWGTLRLHDVPVDADAQLLGAPGEGLAIFRHHLAAFRPLAAATALGTAAGVHRHVLSTLAARRRTGNLPRIRDNALITLGRTHAEILALATDRHRSWAADTTPRSVTARWLERWRGNYLPM